VANLSKNKFAHRFISYINSYGGKIITLNASALTETPPEELETAVENVGANHTDTKKQIKAEDAQSIAEARDISHAEASLIKDALARNRDEDNNSECVEIDAETRREYQKYRIRNHYRWVATMDMKFVQRYSVKYNKEIFRNLQIIANGDNCDDALKIIHRRERDAVSNLSTLGGGSYYANISRNCVYGKHRASILLVRSCGFADLFDKQILSHPRVVGKLRTNHTAVASTMDVASHDMEVSKPSNLLNITHYGDDRYVASMLKYVNRVLKCMYGAEIKSTADKLYRIHLPGVFDYEFGEGGDGGGGGGGGNGGGNGGDATKPTVYVYGEAPPIGEVQPIDDYNDELDG
jgi:hypothetical protein